MDTGLGCHFRSSPVDLPNPGIEPVKSLMSAALAGGSFQVAPPAGILEGAKFRGWKISWGMGETVNCGPERSFNYKTVSSLKA